MADDKKEVLYRGILVSDQYVAQRRLSELTVGQVYKIKRECIKYLGKFRGKDRFQLIF